MKNKMNIKKALRLIICTCILVCFVYAIIYIAVHDFSSLEKYEGNYLQFTYNPSMTITFDEKEEYRNLFVFTENDRVIVCSVLVPLDDMSEELFFESIEKKLPYARKVEVGQTENGPSNDSKGTKIYKEYDILDLDNNYYKVLAQLQKLENGYYIITVAHVEENFKMHENLAKNIMDSISYSDVEPAGDLIPLKKFFSESIANCAEVYSLATSNIGKVTGENTEEPNQSQQEHMDSLPVESVLKDVEGYEYLKQFKIASADGNNYYIMVPGDYDPGDEKRFITYSEHGFLLSMYARELFKGETILDFLDLHKFPSEYEESRYKNIKEAEIVEQDKIVYQICTAERVWEDYEGYEYYTVAHINAAIILGGTDVLTLDLTCDRIYHYDQKTIEYLTELEKYYGIPVTQFVDLAD